MSKNTDITFRNERSNLHDGFAADNHICGDRLPSEHQVKVIKRKASSITTTERCDSPPRRVKSPTGTLASSLKSAAINAVYDEPMDQEDGLSEGTGQFCLVTLEVGLSACLSMCHVVHPVLGIKKSIKLTYAWGHSYGTLNLYTQFNSLCLTSNLHHSFAGNQWALLPLDEDVIKQLVRKPVQVLNQPIERLYENQRTFKYALLPLSQTIGAISRRGQKRLNTTGPHLNKFVTYQFPYTDFPILHSHVQPHFAIFDLMEKILLFEKEKYVDIEDCDEFDKYFDVHKRFKILLTYCRELHDRWLLPVPADFLTSLRSMNSEVKANGVHAVKACSTNSLDSTQSLEDELVGLRPEDSVSCVLGEEGEDTDKELDEVIEENAFIERMSRWIGDIDAGPPPSHDEPRSPQGHE